MTRDSSAWFTRTRWRVLDAASRKVLYRETATLNPRFFTTPDNGMTAYALGRGAAELMRRGLLELLPDPTPTGRPVRVTEFGRILRSQWYHPDGRAKPFPFQGLIEPPRHNLERHYLLAHAEKARELPSVVPNPYLDELAVHFADIDLLTLIGERTYALTTSGAALLAAWRRLPPNLCSCGID